jgi:hypothetical protein
MADTTFIDFTTPIVASWLNDVNFITYGRASTAGQVLISNGPYALPSFQSISASIPVFTSSTDGLVPASGGSTTYLRADGTWQTINLTSPAYTFKGNYTGSSGPTMDLTQAQATATLNVFTSALQGVVPASGGGTTAFLRADGSWAAPPGGGGGGQAAIQIQNGGVNTGAAGDAATYNFTGSGVTASVVGSVATITIGAGASSSAVNVLISSNFGGF